LWSLYHAIGGARDQMPFQVSGEVLTMGPKSVVDVSLLGRPNNREYYASFCT
jgi:hypothetical protein